MTCFVSIVIPTFNRAHLICDSIPKLMNLQCPHDLGYEVLFVSNGSTDNTMTVLEEMASRFDNLRFFEIPPSGGPAAPRNEGIRRASGEIIVILDDDVIPDKTLLQAYIQHHLKFPQQNEAALGVAYVPEKMKSKPVSFFHEFNYDNLQAEQPLCYTYFWTCNISFKRKFMLEYGMFDERLLYNEDIHCGHKLAQAGMVLRFEKNASGQHFHQLRLEDVPAKGRFIGKWIWATSKILATPEVLNRYGVLSTKIGVKSYLKRMLNRIGLRLLDNPLTFLLLKLAGAKQQERSKVTDFYYYLIFRRQILSGFSDTRKRYHKLSKQNYEPIDIIEFTRSLKD